MTIDISQLGELSTAGLLADKVLINIDRIRKHECNVDRNIFELAAEYLTTAMEGLQDVENLSVSSKTVYALGVLDTISKAVSSQEATPVEESMFRRMRALLEQMIERCQKLAAGEGLSERQLVSVEKVFSSISEYTFEAHKVLLATSPKRTLFKRGPLNAIGSEATGLL